MYQGSFCSGSSPVGESPSGEGPQGWQSPPRSCVFRLCPRQAQSCCSHPLCLSFLGSAIKPLAEGPDPEGEWETVRLRGSWRIGQTAGGSRNFASYPTNPCFPLSVPGGAGPRCVRISLHQHCPDGDRHPIGFHVFQASSSMSWGGPSEELSPCGQRADAQAWTPSSGHVGQAGRSRARLISRFHQTRNSLGSQVSSGSHLSTQLAHNNCVTRTVPPSGVTGQGSPVRQPRPQSSGTPASPGAPCP